MDETDMIDGEEPKKKRSRVKWFSFVFAAALFLLGYRTYNNPALVAETVRALQRAGFIFVALGGLALVVGIVGSIVRSPKIKSLDMLEALAFVGVGVFFVVMRSRPEGGGLFREQTVPIVPVVLIVIGVIKGIVAVREYRKLHAR